MDCRLIHVLRSRAKGLTARPKTSPSSANRFVVPLSIYEDIRRCQRQSCRSVSMAAASPPAVNQLPRAVRVGVVGVCQVERAGMRGAGEIEECQIERGRDDLRYPWSAPTRASMTCDRFNAIRSPLRGVSRALSLLSIRAL
jgi:hypothetical protein